MTSIKTFDLESDELFWEISEICGHYHANCLHVKSKFVGSGFARQKETAKKIAFSELNERYIVQQLSSDSSIAPSWLLDFDESCSGFAIGFSRSKTIVRAICEGCERWAISQWIDGRLELPEISCAPMFGNSLSTEFEDYSVFTKEFPILLSDKVLNIHVAVVLAWTTKGVFPGYGANLNSQDSLKHAFIEATRNYLIYKNQKAKDYFPFDRISFFAENKSLAQDIINSIEKSNWPSPTLKFLRAEQFNDFWLARAIFDGWEPWQRGSVTRFLY